MATRELYISSSEAFSVKATHGFSSVTFEAEQVDDEYGWPQDFYRDTSACVQFENGDAVEITAGEDEW